MATGDTATNGGNTNELIEKASQQMSQLDMVGKKLKSVDGDKVNTPTSRNGTRTPGKESTAAAASGDKKPSAKQSSTPASGRTSRKASTTTNQKSPVEPPKPEEPPKKLPMNKIKVGSAASPNIKEVKSKIGSLSSVSTYKSPGGNVKIESKKLNWKAESKIGSLANVTHTPGGGAIKIETKKVEVKNVQSRIGSLGNVKYRPGGGDKKIFDDKEYLKRCSPTSAAPGSKTPSEGVSSPKGAMSPSPASPAPGAHTDGF